VCLVPIMDWFDDAQQDPPPWDRACDWITRNTGPLTDPPPDQELS
jgi:hypothetical protein